MERIEVTFYSDEDDLEDVDEIADKEFDGNRTRAINQALKDFRKKHSDLLEEDN